MKRTYINMSSSYTLSLSFPSSTLRRQLSAGARKASVKSHLIPTPRRQHRCGGGFSYYIVYIYIMYVINILTDLTRNGSRAAFESVAHVVHNSSAYYMVYSDRFCIQRSVSIQTIYCTLRVLLCS